MARESKELLALNFPQAGGCYLRSDRQQRSQIKSWAGGNVPPIGLPASQSLERAVAQDLVRPLPG